MAQPIIRIENISKKYIIGKNVQGSLRHTIASLFTKNNKEEFWALRDVCFEVKQGEVLGIIGANGAGKSTLLKILSRITYPTSGRIELNGRVSSLLEVGTGFHPELTGRENVFLNGSLLGMSRLEIKSKFDEIVDFSGVERFIDTPVKRYSSGMYVRLAFAVAAHLESEILLIDEVLSVGDAEFQKKCLGKMEEVSRGEGRTVLFVSHNLSAIKSMCKTVVYLDQGKKVYKGITEKAIRQYIGSSKKLLTSQALDKLVDTIKLSGIELITTKNIVTKEFSMGQDVLVKVYFANRYLFDNLIMSLRISTVDGLSLISVRSDDFDISPLKHIGQSDFSVSIILSNLNLLPGYYFVSIGLNDGYEKMDYRENITYFEIVSEVNLTKRSWNRELKYSGLVNCNSIWKVVNE